MQANSSLWRSCDLQKQCHCDWRLTVYDCEESEAIRWIYINNAILSALVAVVGNVNQTRPSPFSRSLIFSLIICLLFFLLLSTFHS